MLTSGYAYYAPLDSSNTSQGPLTPLLMPIIRKRSCRSTLQDAYACVGLLPVNPPLQGQSKDSFFLNTSLEQQVWRVVRRFIGLRRSIATSRLVACTLHEKSACCPHCDRKGMSTRIETPS
jgi:hypothetical protein